MSNDYLPTIIKLKTRSTANIMHKPIFIQNYLRDYNIGKYIHIYIYIYIYIYRSYQYFKLVQENAQHMFYSFATYLYGVVGDDLQCSS